MFIHKTDYSQRSKTKQNKINPNKTIIRFGTLKAIIKHLPKQNDSDLPYLIHSFEFWYNQIKPHSNLDKQTPESVYQKKIKQWQKENPPDG